MIYVLEGISKWIFRWIKWDR